MAVALADREGDGARGEAADATESGAGASEEAGADSGAGAGAGAGGSAVAGGDDVPGVEGESVGAEREKEVATVGDRVGGTVFAAGTSELNGNASGAVAGAGKDGRGLAGAGATGDVKAMACGAWNAEAKSGAGAVPGAEANCRESISAGAKLRRAKAGAKASVDTSAELASEGREVDTESKEWRRAPASGERGDGECGEGAAARAEGGVTSGAGPAMRVGVVGAVGAAEDSTAPENGTARAVGTAFGVDCAADAVAEWSRRVSDDELVGIGAVSVSAAVIGAAGGGVTVAASASAISAESGPGSVGFSGATARDEGRARAGAAGFVEADFGGVPGSPPRGETGGATSLAATVAAVVGTGTPGTTPEERGAEVRAGCVVSWGCVEPIQVGGTSDGVSGDEDAETGPVAGVGASPGKSAPKGVAGAPVSQDETVSPPGKSAASRGSAGDVETESCMGKFPSVEHNAPIRGADEM